MAKAKFITDEAVDSFTCGKYRDGTKKGQLKEQDILWDTAIKGFGLRYSSKSKTRTYLFRYRRPVDGREAYITIGRHGAYAADEARVEAKLLARMVEDGKDPVQVEVQYHEAEAAKVEADRWQSLTLRQVMDLYVNNKTTKGRPLRPDTKASIRSTIERYLADWLDQPMSTTVTRNACELRFRQLSAKGRKTAANMSMMYLRALCNYAALQSQDCEDNPRLFARNPVNRMIKSINGLNENKVRTERVPKDKIGAVWNELRRLAVWGYHEDVRIAADWLSVVMLTGMRLTESASLMRSNVDLEGRTLHIPGECSSLPGFYGTKNHKPLTLPLSQPLVDILERRMATCQPNASRPYEHLLCFPSTRGNRVPFIRDPRSSLAMLSKVAGVHFSVHSLRRTTEDILRYAKVDPDERRLILNHISGDVHQASYSNSKDPETLRPAMDAAAAWVLEQSKIAAGANIIQFPQSGASRQTASL